MNEREIFSAALELQGQARRAYLDQACGSDAALRKSVDGLLEEHGRSDGFVLDKPINHGESVGSNQALSAGDTISFYRILGFLGAGGMGTVYRALDTRLEREVAIKVLPEELTDDVERLQRFEREAKTLASLNHPNVAGIHGVDQVDDVCFLELELVPGEDLATRLAKGPLPVHEAIDVCRQIAEGLEAAHEAGVVHRDLKPANVRITPEGVVKVLDFGLAKPLLRKAGKEYSSAAEPDSFLMTEEGIVLGTPTYMSPEQARGKPIDRRTDLWAFGCVFFECLTGQRAFSGDSMTDVLASILGEEPNWELIPPLPPRVQELLQRALKKNPRERLRDAGEARVQLELATAEGSRAVTVNASEIATKNRSPLRPISLLLVLLALAVGYALRLTTEPVVVDSAAIAQAPSTPMAMILATVEEEVSDLELSPDGRFIAWTQASGVYIRALNSFEVTEVTLENTEDAFQKPYRLAWSPDGSQLAFTTPNGLWRVNADGKHLTLVTRDPLSSDSHAQLDWSLDGQLVYSDGASRDLFGRSFLVDKTTPLFSGDEKTTLHFDGVHILPDESLLAVRHRVGIGSPDTLSLWRDDELRDVLQLPGWNITGPAYANGVLAFERKDTKPSSIWSVAMDIETGNTIGDPRPVVDNGLHVTVAGDTLAYVVSDEPIGMRPAWVDLQGNLELFPDIQASETLIPTLSHDGRRTFIFDPLSGGSVKSYDSVSGVRTHAANLEAGVVAIGDLPDGRLLAIEISSGVPTETLAVAPSGASEVICQGYLVGVSRDGRLGLSLRIGEQESPAIPELSMDVVDLEGKSEPIALSLTPRVGAFLSFGAISPDNRWALIHSDDQGRGAIVMVSTQGDPRELTVASDRAVSPTFNHSGDTIYYWTSTAPGGTPLSPESELWQVSWQAEPEPKLGTPKKLFTLREPILITGFDYQRNRFLGAWKQAAGTHQILARTRWTTTEDKQ